MQHHRCGGGAAYLQGQGCLMHPPRADSLLSESIRVRVHWTGRRERSESELHELLKSRVQVLLWQWPLRRVSEGGDIAVILLNELTAFI